MQMTNVVLGTCLCTNGWNGKHCTLEGCPANCNGIDDDDHEDDDDLIQIELKTKTFRPRYLYNADLSHGLGVPLRDRLVRTWVRHSA